MKEKIKKISKKQDYDVVVAISMPNVENVHKEAQAIKSFSGFIKDKMIKDKQPVRYFLEGKGIIIYGETSRILGNPEYLETFAKKLGDVDDAYIFGM